MHEVGGLLQRLEHAVGGGLDHRVGALDHEHAPGGLERRTRGGGDHGLVDVGDEQLVRAGGSDPREIGMRPSAASLVRLRRPSSAAATARATVRFPGPPARGTGRRGWAWRRGPAPARARRARGDGARGRAGSASLPIVEGGPAKLRAVNETEVLIVGLLIGVAGLSALARMIHVPYPIVLVIGGAALGFIPGIPDFVLNPDVVLLVFLPPLLYGAAFFADFQQMRRNLRPIMLLSIGLVLATMFAVAVVAHAAIPGLPWAAAFVLGAVVSPTDPLAGTSIMRRLDVPARLVSGLEGEGLFNDATALVAYRVAIGAAIGTGFSLAEASAAVRGRRGRRDRHRAGGRLAHGRDPQAHRRRPALDHRLAAVGLRRLRARERARGLGRARRGDLRHLRRPPRPARHPPTRAPPEHLRVGGARLPAQRHAVRARRPAVAHDRGHPRRVLGRRTGRLRPRGQRRR